MLWKLDLNQLLLFKLKHFTNIERVTLGPLYIIISLLSDKKLLNNTCSSALTIISCFSSQLYDLVLYATANIVHSFPSRTVWFVWAEMECSASCCMAWLDEPSRSQEFQNTTRLWCCSHVTSTSASFQQVCSGLWLNTVGKEIRRKKW